MTTTDIPATAPPLQPADEELLRALLAQSLAAHERVAQDDPADYWSRLGQRTAHAHAAGLLVAGPGDRVRADAIADRIVLLLSETLPAPSCEELYAAAVAPYPPASVHPEAPGLRWLESKAFAAAYPNEPNSIDDQYGSAWGPRRDTALLWRHQPGVAVGMLYAHDLTWDEYAVLATHVEARDVETAYRAACRSDLPVTPETFTSLLPRRTPQPDPEQPATGSTVRRPRDAAVGRPEPAPAAPDLGLTR